MRVGVTGHQHRPGIDWAWVSHAISDALDELAPVSAALTSLAVGADQAFAREALRRSIPVTAVIPLPDYDRFFKGWAAAEYEFLLSKCSEVIHLSGRNSPEESFLFAGEYILDHCDHLLAIWDGQQSGFKGGTADVVALAQGRRRSITWLDPIKAEVRRL